MISAAACVLTAGVLGLSSGPSVPAAQAEPVYSVDWHLISSGGSTVAAGSSRSSCFVVDGTIGQTVPGFSNGGIYAVYAGFWTPMPNTQGDEIFFNGFEGCAP